MGVEPFATVTTPKENEAQRGAFLGPGSPSLEMEEPGYGRGLLWQVVGVRDPLYSFLSFSP